MDNLVKIKDVSARYDITARTLRYYEDMGLITSIRSDDYAYRMYDETAVNRLEQILILRKLNISIKDIQLVFSTASSASVLGVLEKKVQHIDDEVALLHELKDIVLDFIREIQRVNFANNSDIKQLYDKAKEIETQLVSVDYIGKPSNVTRLLEITDELDTQIPDVMVVEIPKCKAITTGYHSWNDMMKKDGASGVVWNHTKLFKYFIFDCPDFLIKRTNDMYEWICAVKDDVTEADVAPTKLFEFEGGLYAMSVTINGNMDSIDKVMKKMQRWLDNTNFEFDDSRGIAHMGNMPYNHKSVKTGLGYLQLQRYIPIKLSESKLEGVNANRR